MSANLPPRNAARFTLDEIARATNGTMHGENGSVCGVVTDTRLLESVSASTCRPLFVALRGTNFDGHRFVESARDNGASALLVESSAPLNTVPRPFVAVGNTQTALGELAKFHRARFDIPVIGVTGSYGKTTTRALIAQALRPKYLQSVLQTQGNFNNEIGVPLTLLALDENHGAAVVEMAMRGMGEIEYLANIARPTLGVITNIGPQHIELLGGLEEIAHAKAEILAHLPADGAAVLPRDDTFFDVLKAAAPCQILSFGTHESADFRVEKFRVVEGNRSEFTVVTPKQSLSVALPLPGLHNAINAACALACASTCGVDLEAAANALNEVEVPGARMRVFEANGATVINDCYNAGPGSMCAALQVLAGFDASRRRVAILGAMRELGDWSDDEHRNLGVLAMQSGVQVLVGVGDETRPMMEAAHEIGNDCLFAWAQNAADATEIAREVVRVGDVVLVKGSRSVGLELVVSALDVDVA